MDGGDARPASSLSPVIPRGSAFTVAVAALNVGRGIVIEVRWRAMLIGPTIGSQGVRLRRHGHGQPALDPPGPPAGGVDRADWLRRRGELTGGLPRRDALLLACVHRGRRGCRP